MKTYQRQVSRGLLMCCAAFAVTALAQEAGQDGAVELSFFEYLGTMVEQDGTWLDPLDLDNDALVQETSVDTEFEAQPATQLEPQESEEAKQP